MPCCSHSPPHVRAVLGTSTVSALPRRPETPVSHDHAPAIPSAPTSADVICARARVSCTRVPAGPSGAAFATVPTSAPSSSSDQPVPAPHEVPSRYCCTADGIGRVSAASRSDADTATVEPLPSNDGAHASTVPRNRRHAAPSWDTITRTSTSSPT